MQIQFMQYSKQGEALTEGFEAKRNNGYWDKIGKVWTVGYGATGPGIGPNTHWTDEQCISWLRTRFASIAARLNPALRLQPTQPEFDAFCDFGYNLGTGALLAGKPLRLFNAGDHKDAAAAFEEYDHANGVVIAGLLRRRLAEEKQFNNQQGVPA